MRIKKKFWKEAERGIITWHAYYWERWNMWKKFGTRTWWRWWAVHAHDITNYVAYLTKRLDICYISICHTLLESQTDSINVQVHRHYHHHNQLFVFFYDFKFSCYKRCYFFIIVVESLTKYIKLMLFLALMSNCRVYTWYLCQIVHI